MKTTTTQNLTAAALLACVLSAPVHAQVISNGGFESGLAGWTTADQIGSDGTFTSQSGTASPVNAFPVPAPPQGIAAVMTDARGPGSHVLYQDIVIPAGSGPFTLAFALFVRNTEGADEFFVPGALTILDFATPELNQQARVDILLTSANPFSVAPADILQNLFTTSPGDPLVSGYTHFLVDVTALFLAHPGQTLRLRFADVDNVSPFNLGVDDVAVVSSLAAAKTVSGTLFPGGTVAYTVTLTNNGLFAQGDNPGNEFTDVLPAELVLVSATATAGTAVAAVATNTVTWNGSIAAGSSVTVTIQATVGSGVASGTTVSNQGTAAFDSDGNGANESSASTDDPAVGGVADPTQFIVAAPSVIEIPALDGLGLALLALALAIAAAFRLRL
jgi:uncharacterized repeat protein (TIGR01451 family)